MKLPKVKSNYKFYITVSLAILCMVTTLLSVGFGALNQDLTIAGDVRYTQDPGNMIMSRIGNLTTDFHGSTYKTKIKTVDFLDNKNIPVTAVDSWDVSAVTNSGRVMAWVIDDPDNEGYYKLYIGTDGKVIGNTDSRQFFASMTGIEEINFNDNFDTSKVTNMGNMFAGCHSLKTLDLSSLNTENVSGMDSTFIGCSSLESIDLSNFNMSNVSSMTSTFGECTSLETLDLSNRSFNRLSNMHYTFNNCSSLEYINLSDLNMYNIQEFEYSFMGCNSLKRINLSNLYAPILRTVESIFYGASQLEELNLSGFTANSLTTTAYMFNGLTSITEIDLSDLHIPNLTNMMQMFYQCTSLRNINFSDFDTSKVTNMSTMFLFCSNLINLDLRSFDTSKVTNMDYMFYGCSGLTQITISSLWNTSSVTSSSDMFSGCTHLPNFDSNYLDKAKAIPTTEGGYLTLFDGFTQGEYFIMVPESNATLFPAYTLGYYENQSINPRELTLWRIINVNNDGSYDAISEYTSSTKIYFATDVGYTRLINGLKTIASIYAKSGYTVGTRYFGYDGQTLIIENTSQYDGQSPISGAPSTTSTPTPLTGTGTEYSNGLLGDTLYLKDYLLVKNVYGNLIANKVGTTSPEPYWIASRKYEYDSLLPTHDYGGRYIDANGDVKFNAMASFVDTDGPIVGMPSSSIRPIITLKASALPQNGQGTKNDPYILY